ncbi:hypothetical protein GCM10022225_42490 [Plantactinospora mayteni]|uniref:Calcium-binding protein n=1 Tax=Plantactinospora mayteni TaxID=566021 RepID=A0ABQ4ESA8_9ACTN|nr:hypothetical protein [Plantactinospora mayteni]GIG97540.1 hypothetical protein Pma05_41130 [Plantactinospora mayteni]
MSDFDDVLERLVTDPAFAAALAADPVGALAGYRLDADELALLQLQLGGGTDGQHGVETRANQSSLFGMFTPLAGLAGALPGVGEIGTAGLGPAGSSGAAGAGLVQGFGAAADPGPGVPPFVEAPGCAVPVGPGSAGVPVGGLTGLGDEIGREIGSATDGALAQPAGGLAGALADPDDGLAAALADAEVGFGPAAEVGFGSAPEAGPPAEVGFGPAEPLSGTEGRPAVPEGYRTRVDVDGDGEWDRHTLQGRADGGVDILVDLDRDGRTDFVGHDLDADGLVDISEYDKNRDGFFEKRMYDDDGDGWMDRTVRAEPPPTDSSQ